MPGAARKQRTQPAPRPRLSPEHRREQLLTVAARLLTEQGVDGLQFTELAAAAGVTRPVVYKFFPSRPALIAAVLGDFEDALRKRFVEGAARHLPGTLEEITRVFVDAVCDAIEDKGAGPWHLLASNGPDPEAARLGREIQERLVAPWYQRIAEATGASPREVETVSAMLVAAGRAVLERWYAGGLSRAEAARDATRGVSALLRAFMRDEGETPPSGPRPRRRAVRG